MKLNDLIIYEALNKMTKNEMGMGMTAYQNDEVALVGGVRSGNSDSEHTRLKYVIYDIKGKTREDVQQNMKKYEVGFVELFVLDGTGKIDGLVNIEMKPKFRRGGFGKKVIQSLMKTIGGDLKVFDIKQKALTFWKKMGVTFMNHDFSKVIDKPRDKKYKVMGLRGIIKK